MLRRVIQDFGVLSVKILSILICGSRARKMLDKLPGGAVWKDSLLGQSQFSYSQKCQKSHFPILSLSHLPLCLLFSSSLRLFLVVWDHGGLQVRVQFTFQWA